MGILSLTREDLIGMEFRKPEGDYNGFVIVPTGDLHDSGFGCMKFVLTNNTDVVGCVGGYCDVVHLNGPGGYGKFEGDGRKWEKAVTTRKVDVVPWSIDCLPSGFLRVFTKDPLSIDDIICSDFNIYA